jgi:ATP-dependent DNA helicase RecG
MVKKKYSPEELMKLAIEESFKSIPEHTDKADPLVGAIVTTKDGEILATAHRGELRIGEHCEYTLIERKLKDHNLRECVLYVTLEPCIDEVRESPKRGCSTHITKARISTVYIGMRDPNPKVENEGAKFLTEKGIKVIDFPSHLEAEIRKSNAQFIKEKELEQMQLKFEKVQKPKSYLQKAVSSSTISQFDEKAVTQFLQFSGALFSYPSEEFNQWALGFEIADKDVKGVFHPTRLGLILFGEKLEDIYPHTIFKIEINYDKGDPEIRDFGGPIVSQLTPILNHIKDKALKLTIDRSKGKREEQADFPLEVLREAIANAIIHRDYENEKATNYLSISSDKIIVRSPGNPESPLTLEDLKTFDTPSVSRNPKIMFVFNKMGLAEQRGIGLRNMKQLNELGFPLPTFDLKAGMLQVTFGRTKEFIAEAKGVDSSKLSQEDKDGLLFIQENSEVSVSDYATHFNLEVKTANRRLRNLVNKGLVIQTGEKKGTRYKLN